MEDKKIIECIDNSKYESELTEGEKYEVVNENNTHYTIVDNNKDRLPYLKRRFKEIEQPIPINYEEEYKKLKKRHNTASKYSHDLSEAQNNMILELDKELKECKKLLAASEDHNKIFSEENERLKKEKRIMESDLIKYEGTIKDLKTEKEALEWSKKEYIKTIDSLRRQIKNMELENENHKERMIKLDDENEALSEEVEELKEKLETPAITIEEYNMMKSKIKDYEDIIDKKDKEIQEEIKGRTIIPDYRKERDKLIYQLSETKKIIEIKEKELQKLRSKLEEAELLPKMIKKLVEVL